MWSRVSWSRRSDHYRHGRKTCHPGRPRGRPGKDSSTEVGSGRERNEERHRERNRGVSACKGPPSPCRCLAPHAFPTGAPKRRPRTGRCRARPKEADRDQNFRFARFPSCTPVALHRRDGCMHRRRASLRAPAALSESPLSFVNPMFLPKGRKSTSISITPETGGRKRVSRDTVCRRQDGCCRRPPSRPDGGVSRRRRGPAIPPPVGA